MLKDKKHGDGVKLGDEDYEAVGSDTVIIRRVVIYQVERKKEDLLKEKEAEEEKLFTIKNALSMLSLKKDETD